MSWRAAMLGTGVIGTTGRGMIYRRRSSPGAGTEAGNYRTLSAPRRLVRSAAYMGWQWSDMNEWRYVISTGFAVRVPPTFSGEILTDRQMRLSDTSLQAAMEIQLITEYPACPPANVKKKKNAAADADSPDVAGLKHALTKAIRRNKSIRAVGECREVKGMHHPTVFCVAIEPAGLAPMWLHNMLGRKPLMHWRLWAVGSAESWLLAVCHGPSESMIELHDIQDRIINSIRLLPASAQIQGSFIKAVAQQACRLFPAKVVDVVDDQTLSLDGIRINVTPLLQDFLGHPQSLESAAKAFLDDLLLKRADERIPSDEWQNLRDRIVPVLMSEDQIASIPPDTFTEEWTNGLLVCYRIDKFDNLVTHADRRRWGTAPSTLRKQAMMNLHRRTRNVELISGSCDDCRVVSFAGRDDLNSSRILLPSVHAKLHSRLGANFLVAMPDRDTLLAFQIEAPEQVEKFRRHVSAWYAETSHPLCEQLFLVTPHGVAAEDSTSMKSWRQHRTTSAPR